jgi:hypothetical protein
MTLKLPCARRQRTDRAPRWADDIRDIGALLNLSPDATLAQEPDR